MNYQNNQQLVKNLSQDIATLRERLVFGFNDRKGLTRQARQQMLVMLEQIVFFSLFSQEERKLKAKDREKFNPHDRVAAIGKEALLKPIEVPYSTDKGTAAIEQQLGKGCSGGQLRRLREFGQALGIYTIQDRTFDRYDLDDQSRSEGERLNGQFCKGANLGKKWITRLYNVSLLELLKVSSALIQSLKAESYDDTEIYSDAWEAYAPKGKCHLLAAVWKELDLPGTLYCPPKVKEEVRPTIVESAKETVEQVVSGLQRKLERLTATIAEYQIQARLKRESQGKNETPWFWQIFKNCEREKERTEAELRSMLSTIVQPESLAFDLPF